MRPSWHSSFTVRFGAAVAASLLVFACSSNDGSQLCIGSSCDDGPGLGENDDGPGHIEQPKDPNDTTCAEVNVTFTSAIPYVTVVIDQSGSMTADFGNGTRWSVLRNALLDDQIGIIKRMEDDVRFGLALYTSIDGFNGGVCPIVNQVSAQFGNFGQIRAVFDAADPVQDTPTAESLALVALQMQKIQLNRPTPKVMVLATDGEPDTCADPDGHNDAARQQSVDAVNTAYAAGIPTYVISVGDEVGEDHLQDLANAGAGKAPGGDARYFQALDQNELYDAFDIIVNGVRDCVFTLNGEIVDGYEDKGTVVLNGQSLPKDDPDGYRVNNKKEIQLTGKACEEIQEGDDDLKVTFPCGGFDPGPIN